jgi:superfamily II DNA or RNA helicase
MGFKFLIKDEEKGYVGTWLWVPKKFVNVERLKSVLEFEVFNDDERYLQLWEETEHHLAIPRRFLTDEQMKKLKFPIIDITPSTYPTVEFQSELIMDLKNPRKNTQKDAFRDFMKSDGGLLNLSCGLGKTCIALHAVARIKRPTLIIVNQKTILDQWEKAIKNFLVFKGDVGIIHEDPRTWNWKHPITVAMLHTLVRHRSNVTPQMRRWFGVVIWDECHHLSAPSFCITATMFPGTRYGLSATMKREDGTEVIYNYHLGKVFHKNLSQEVKPKILFKHTSIVIPPNDFDEHVLDRRGMMNISKLRSYVGQLEERNLFIYKDLKKALKSGRKILALSHSKTQLNMMHEQLLNEGLDCGICTGDNKVLERWKALRERQLIFGTHQLVMEAIDEESLDTLFWLTPFGSQNPEGGKNALQQGMGRIQGYRFQEGMKDPLVVIYDDIYIRHLHRMCNQLRKQLRNWPPEESGPYEFSNVKVKEA